MKDPTTWQVKTGSDGQWSVVDTVRETVVLNRGRELYEVFTGRPTKWERGMDSRAIQLLMAHAHLLEGLRHSPQRWRIGRRRNGDGRW